MITKVEKLNNIYCLAGALWSVRLQIPITRLGMFCIGVCSLQHGLLELAHAQTIGYEGDAGGDDGQIRCAVAELFRFIEGAFGALVMVVSGLGAIVSAAMGAYRASVGMLIVGLGSFILRSLVAVLFGTDFPVCSYED